jgi:hypothetical protein
MKLKLDEDSSVENFFEGTKILGIVSTLKNYTFCWHIQQEINIFFGTTFDNKIALENNKRLYSFTIYDYFDPILRDQHYLYTNKHDGECLLPELQHFDYIWLYRCISGEPSVFYKIQKNLKLIQGVQMVLEIEHSRIKSKNNLQR